MRTALLIGFIGLLLGQSTYNLLVVGHYLLDFERYATELCTNKDRPEMHCNGTCHLAVELADPTPTEPPALPEVLTLETWYVPPTPSPLAWGPALEGVNRTALRRWTPAIRSGWSRRLERPPGCDQVVS